MVADSEAGPRLRSPPWRLPPSRRGRGIQEGPGGSTGIQGGPGGSTGIQGGPGGLRRDTAELQGSSGGLGRRRRGMAFEGGRKRDGMSISDSSAGESGVEELGRTSGRSQREKKRSYKDFLREEEETFAEAWKTSKKRHRSSEGISSRDGDGLKLKLILSPKDKSSTEEEGTMVSYGMMVPAKKAAMRRPPSRFEPGEIGEEDYVRMRKGSAAMLARVSESSETSVYSDSRVNMSESGDSDSDDSDGVGDPGMLGASVVGVGGGGGGVAAAVAVVGLGVDGPAESLSDFELSGLEAGEVTGTSEEEGLITGDFLSTYYRPEVRKKKKVKKSKKKKDKGKQKKHKKHRKHAVGALPECQAAAAVVAMVSPAAAASLPLRGMLGDGVGAEGVGVFGGKMSGVPGIGSPYAIPQPPPPILHSDGKADKRKKREADKEKDEKPEKKKAVTAYHLWSKEYRHVIIAESPGMDFGEISKKLGDVWKRLPEKEKLVRSESAEPARSFCSAAPTVWNSLPPATRAVSSLPLLKSRLKVWKQKQQYLQHKQNKAEATTVRRKGGDLLEPDLPRPKASGGSHKKGLSGSPKPRALDMEAVDVAAHLQLLGESLSLIGHRLQETEGMVAVSGGLSVMLDSLLCALGPLACLTAQVDEINGCSRLVLANTLDNIAYVMPGL
ncbi:HMG domain-containing protein 4 isoform X2 [Petromyzon marinus]|uniref:HMG domain-containing protein 4 isoform X2 n=1 Tax=Petromyzon marinus TaxID=7757 RepID=UPI003F71A20E